MLNQMTPIQLYRAAAEHATAVVDAVRPDQLRLPTPCTEWTVQELIDHLVGGTEYLLSAAEQREPRSRCHATAADYRSGVADVLDAVRRPGAVERTCTSPLGFEWTLAEAVAGTFMDVLIHTWDLARATGQDDALNADLVEACTAMFLLEMPGRGRAAGIIGPAVDVGDEASTQDRLLGAMGRTP
jgi:uncharacterized protein (TIGR03086 family)